MWRFGKFSQRWGWGGCNFAGKNAMKKIFCFAGIVAVGGLMMVGCRARKVSERSQVVADGHMEYRSIGYEAALRLDSAFSRLDFGADSITIASVRGADSTRRTGALNVTIHNPRGSYDRTAISRTRTTATVADTISASATIDSSGETMSIETGRGTKWSFIVGIIVGAVICRWVLRKS